MGNSYGNFRFGACLETFGVLGLLAYFMLNTRYILNRERFNQSCAPQTSRNQQGAAAAGSRTEAAHSAGLELASIGASGISLE